MGPVEEQVNAYLYRKEAERTYDPSKGASLETHINSYMQKAQRDQSVAGSTLKSSEQLGLSINKIRRAEQEHYMVHGVEPTVSQLSKSTGYSPKIISKHKGIASIKTVGVDDFTPKQQYVDMQTLLPDLKGHTLSVAKAMSSGDPMSKVLKDTGMSKSSYYRASKNIRDRMRQAYLRNNQIGV
jgi:uncharacterized protein (UPF0335 family)